MRRRLAWLSFAVASLVVVAFLFPVAILIRNQAENRALAGAERDVASVAAALAVASSVRSADVLTPDFGRTVLAAFANPDGLSIVFHDDTVVGSPLEISANIEQARRGSAFTARVDDGAEILVPVLLPDAPSDNEVIVVQTLVPDDELTRGVATAWFMLGALGLFLIGVAVLAADRLGRSVVRPVTELSDAALRWGEGDLDIRVVPGGPEEIAEVGEAFNLLAARLDSMLEREREEVADLSHRLRTPLTALRLQAEMISNVDERESLKADIRALEEAVDLMIAQARSKSEPATVSDAVVDIGEVVVRRAEFWQVLADEQGRPTSLTVEEGPHLVQTSRAELGALIDILIENIFAHTPAGVGYKLSVRTIEDTCVLSISDDGPGFADLALRRRGRSGAGSTGLGLDIVERTAERTGGGMTIGTSTDGGAEVSVRFGLAEGHHLVDRGSEVNNPV